MSSDLHATAARWLAAGEPGVVIEVVKTAGSVPRETGTRMLVSARHAVGTIGGGHLELMAIENARTLLAKVPGFEPVDRHYPLGPALGQCCGGVVQLAFEAVDHEHLEALAQRRREDSWRLVALDGAPELALFDNANVEDSIHRSKAVGEPPLLLPFSVFLAIRDAVSAVGDHRVDPPLRAPATSEAILDAIDAVLRGQAKEAP